ncbi:aspartic proteinase CDR1 [Selaginella moellendorffii]|nr:aspartic proteinase CDR1 [Selaginella moellendorffii]|eukprot:XP_002962041.2 aspartic proteinase CDR1 [Selaginella moellendorffii]
MASAKFFALALLSYAFLLLIVATLLLAAVPRIHVHNFTPQRQRSSGIASGHQEHMRRKLLAHQEHSVEQGSMSSTISSKSSAVPSQSSTIPGFRASLVRRSSTHAANSTRAERLRDAVHRSKARAKALAERMSEKITPTKLDYQSPVASISGAYTMEIELGSPPKKFNAIVDTGSDLVWIQCKPCSQCYSQSDPIYDPSASSTFAKTSCSTSSCQSLPASGCSSSAKTCIYGYQYGDSSSTQGDFALETLTLRSSGGSSKAFPNFQFGCGRLNSGSFGGAAGIVGLGQGKISLSTQLGSAINNKFSYCLVDFDDDSSKTSPLIFGSSASTGSGAISTPIIPNSGRSTYYFVGLEGISVGGKQLSLATRAIDFLSVRSKKKLRVRALEVNSGGTIFDSGTTLTLLDDAVYSKVKSAFASSVSLPTVDASSSGFDLCYDVSKSKNFKFPALTLAFKGTKFSPPQKNYFVIVDTAETVACLAMGGSGSLGLGIIGNLMQQNYHVVYDRGTSTISMSPAQCDSL